MGLGLMDGVVNPAGRLLDTEVAPLLLAQEGALGDELRDLGRQNDVPIRKESILE